MISFLNVQTLYIILYNIKQFSDCGQEVLAAQYCRCLVPITLRRQDRLNKYICVETHIYSTCVPQKIPIQYKVHQYSKQHTSTTKE